MSKRKNGMGLLGLLAVTAFGMMAFTSSALAVTPQFTVGGAPSSAALDAKFEGTQAARGTLSIPGLNAEVNCEKGEIIGGLIASPTDAKVERILFKECSALEFKSPLAELAGCHVTDVHTGALTSLHITALNPLLLPVEFSNGEYGVLAEKISVFVNFLTGVGCVLPTKTEVKGEVCFKISGNETAEPTVTTSETIQTSCPKRIALEGLESNPVGGTFEDKLLYGAQAAFITGSAKLKLLAPHAGSNLGVSLK